MEPIIHYRVYKPPMNTQTCHTNPIYTLTPFRDSVVGIPIMLWAERSGARIPVGKEIFFFPKRPDRRRGPPTLLNEYRDAYHGGGEKAAVA